jgi:hypothetical protein
LGIIREVECVRYGLGREHTDHPFFEYPFSKRIWCDLGGKRNILWFLRS